MPTNYRHLPCPFTFIEERPKAQDFVAAGMWADREDMSDPTGYVRNLRKKRSF